MSSLAPTTMPVTNRSVLSAAEASTPPFRLPAWDVLMRVRDGFKGLSEAVETVCPRTIVQSLRGPPRCVIESVAARIRRAVRACGHSPPQGRRPPSAPTPQRVPDGLRRPPAPSDN
ncbi:hypothetical protein F9278_45740 [Streptomyces phaeolivaceus]|uniref:Transposase n=1 Tax=Streptomyces phaeolivaceus TaxID=2653200 RepID=A0A5P8KGI2_9ACTN|nr:hypothetical protein F9278_45740 [Streptomyces phaeolivaceus]